MSRFDVKRSFRQLLIERRAIILLISDVDYEISQWTGTDGWEKLQKLKSRQQANKAFLTDIEKDLQSVKAFMDKLNQQKEGI